ncbi:hypothetical protein FRC07_010191 [Ceratobasidium sp. 392]|nr:hypothetical protein FRC07_010191 [Ceratobasidium sp. 392]
MHTLAIYPEWDHLTEADEFSLEFVSDGDKPVVQNQLQQLGPFFTYLHPLVALSISDEIINHSSCFVTIAGWSSLESLEIALDPSKSEYSLPRLPKNAFPSLKHFALYWFDYNILLPDSTFSEGHAFTTVLARMLKKIGNRCPKLQDFWLRAVGFDSMSLRLEGVEALAHQKTKGAIARELHTTMAQEMGSMFPDLKVLGFPKTSLSFLDLPALISALPHLEAVCFDFLASAHADLASADLAQVARFRISPLHTVEFHLFGKRNASGEATSGFAGQLPILAFTKRSNRLVCGGRPTGLVPGSKTDDTLNQRPPQGTVEM